MSAPRRRRTRRTRSGRCLPVLLVGLSGCEFSTNDSCDEAARSRLADDFTLAYFEDRGLENNIGDVWITNSSQDFGDVGTCYDLLLDGAPISFKAGAILPDGVGYGVTTSNKVVRFLIGESDVSALFELDVEIAALAVSRRSQTFFAIQIDKQSAPQRVEQLLRLDSAGNVIAAYPADLELPLDFADVNSGARLCLSLDADEAFAALGVAVPAIHVSSKSRSCLVINLADGAIAAFDSFFSAWFVEPRTLIGMRWSPLTAFGGSPPARVEYVDILSGETVGQLGCSRLMGVWHADPHLGLALLQVNVTFIFPSAPGLIGARRGAPPLYLGSFTGERPTLVSRSIGDQLITRVGSFDSCLGISNVRGE